MTAVWRLLGWIGVVSLAVTACIGVGYSLATNAARTAVFDAQMQSVELAYALDSATRHVRIDSVRVDSVVTRWRTARAGVDTITDTVRLVDTLRVLVADAEDALNVCTLAFDGCSNALAIAERKASADSVQQARTTALLAIQTDRTARAESRTWRHRLEGVAACGVSVYTINQLTRK